MKKTKRAFRKSIGTITELVVAMVIVAVLLLSGCGQKKETKNTLIFAYGSSIKADPVFRDILEAFKYRHPEISVKLMGVQGDYYAKVMTMIAGNTAPDVMWMGQSFSEYASRGAFLDLTPRIQKEIDISKYYERVVSWYRYNGKYYGFPYSMDMDMLFYNKNLFDQAGLPYPNEKWTIKELVAVAQKLTVWDKNGRIKQYGYAGGYDLGPFGADILNADNTECTLDRPEAIEALQFNVDLEKKYKVSPVLQVSGEASGTGMTPDVLFQAGRLAMIHGYTWNLPDFHKKITAFDWDITLMPIAKKRSHWASSGGYAISSQTKYPEEAWTFFKFLISPEAQKITSASTFPVCRDVAQEVIKAHTGPPDHFNLFLEAIPYLQPYPRTSETSKVMNEYAQAMGQATAGMKSPAAAFKEGTVKIDEILRNSKKRSP